MSASIDAAQFRHLCGHFATGVTIITAREGETLRGMTASSFASVSLEPPLISVAVDHTATIYPAMLKGAQFTVNILEETQEALSRRFAESLDARFDGVPCRRTADEYVLLDGALAYLCCEKWAEVPAGDHTIFVGRVIRGDIDPAAKPLLHYRGRYHEF